MKDKLWSDPRFYTVGTSDIEIAGPSSRRVGLIISTPPPNAGNPTPVQSSGRAVDVSTLGVKDSYTVPAGITSVLVGAFNKLTAGAAPTIQLRVAEGGSALIALQNATDNLVQPNIVVIATGVIDWNVSVVGAAGVMDFNLSILNYSVIPRVTVAFRQTAVLDQGMNLYAGNPPFMLTEEFMGVAIKEEVHAIGSIAGLLIQVIDLLEP